MVQLIAKIIPNSTKTEMIRVHVCFKSKSYEDNTSCTTNLEPVPSSTEAWIVYFHVHTSAKIEKNFNFRTKCATFVRIFRTFV